ncbi:MAG TPA: phasin family protein [Xanthobacteraceae bacterium]|nr:phasin family protein [Xanthobacteraceae bacterium]
MAKDPFAVSALPEQARAVVEQARTAFNEIVETANKAVGQWQGQAEAAHSGASEIAHKSMSYAEKNMAATFDFVQKLMQAKDPTEVVRLQSAFLSSQMQALSAQAQELGLSAAETIIEATKAKP